MVHDINAIVLIVPKLHKIKLEYIDLTIELSCIKVICDLLEARAIQKYKIIIFHILYLGH